MLEEVKVLVKSWLTKTRATKRDIQKLLVKLNWCARVFTGGRTFLRNLIDRMKKLARPNHYVRLSSAARADITWWSTGLDLFHGFTHFTDSIPLPQFKFATDACLTGCGGHYNSQWFYVNWANDMPEMNLCHINVL